VKLSEHLLWIPIVLRFAFFALVVVLVRLPEIFDLWKFVAVFLLGFSHGYCASLAMMSAPVHCKVHEQEQGAVILVSEFTTKLQT